MRFSLKWSLAATAYVAVAAAAFGQGAWYFAEILWAASLLALVYALLLVCFFRGRRQITAAGFVLASACFLLSLHFGGAGSVPTSRILKAANISNVVTPYYASPNAYPVYSPPQIVVSPRPQTAQPMPVAPPTRYSTVDTIIVGAPTPVPAPGYAPTPVIDFAVYSRAGNAVATMLFGLLGCAVGALAHRTITSQQSPQGE